jgi:general secretion pathway protein N
MMNRRPPLFSLGTAALIATGATMAVAPGIADTADKPATAAARIVQAAQAAPEGNPIRAIPLADMSITRDRPLFSPSRRPPPPPAPPPVYAVASVSKPVKTEPDRPSLMLVGTIVGGNEAIAVFLDRTTRNVVRLHPSESHEGWVLRSIQGREATLEKGRNSAVLALAPPGGTPEVATAQATPEQVRRPRR